HGQTSVEWRNRVKLPSLRGKAEAGARGLVWPSRYAGEIWSNTARRGDFTMAIRHETSAWQENENSAQLEWSESLGESHA
ncbi:hypothetical protein KI387_013027, partial [Taxus chinensis]